MPTVLIADDEPAIRRALREILEFEGYTVEEAVDGDEALDKARTGVDLVLLDIKMPKRDGMEVLQALHDAESTIPVVMISGHGTVETAVEATQLGAVDFLEKPPDLNRLLVTVRGALGPGPAPDRERPPEAGRPRRGHVGPDADRGRQPGHRAHPADRRAGGADRGARAHHRRAGDGQGAGRPPPPRPAHPGRRTARGGQLRRDPVRADRVRAVRAREGRRSPGATKQRIGKFEQADGGTLFLDEIGDMSLDAQAKVLRALQESRITRVGGDRSITVDVRVVAATNRDLLQQVDERRFREDLYHRLSVILIHVPPLRERRSDIPDIAQFILGQVMRRNGMADKTFESAALDRLRQQDWRGNVRELRNVVERLLILSDGDEITAADVERYVVPAGSSGSAAGLIDRYDTLFEFRDHAEKLFIERKLNENDWNVSATAELIGIQRSHLYNKLKELDIERPE